MFTGFFIRWLWAWAGETPPRGSPPFSPGRGLRAGSMGTLCSGAACPPGTGSPYTQTSPRDSSRDSSRGM